MKTYKDQFAPTMPCYWIGGTMVLVDGEIRGWIDQDPYDARQSCHYSVKIAVIETYYLIKRVTRDVN